MVKHLTTVSPDTPLEAALRHYQHCADRLKHAEAKIEGNVVCDFRLDDDPVTQAKALLEARHHLELALFALGDLLATIERQTDANAESPESPEATESPDAPRAA